MMPPENPIEPSTYTMAAVDQSPSPTNQSAADAAIPRPVKAARYFLRDPPPSAMAPRIGAATRMNTLPMEFANPSWAVLVTASAPALQYCLKKTGKNPAMTVVANTEFAQSYSAQEKIGRLANISRTRCMRMPPDLRASPDGREVRCLRPPLRSDHRPVRSGCIHSLSLDHLRRPEAALTAMAIALRWPTRTTRRLPRVTPV